MPEKHIRCCMKPVVEICKKAWEWGGSDPICVHSQGCATSDISLILNAEMRHGTSCRIHRSPLLVEDRPNAIMFISCYELGHQPLGIAQPMGFLEQAGYFPVGLDIAVEPIDEPALQSAQICRDLGPYAYGTPAWGAGSRADSRDKSVLPHLFLWSVRLNQCGIFASGAG